MARAPSKHSMNSLKRVRKAVSPSWWVMMILVGLVAALSAACLQSTIGPLDELEINVRVVDSHGQPVTGSTAVVHASADLDDCTIGGSCPTIDLSGKGRTFPVEDGHIRFSQYNMNTRIGTGDFKLDCSFDVTDHGGHVYVNVKPAEGCKHVYTVEGNNHVMTVTANLLLPSD
jgi:hypothetical protein